MTHVDVPTSASANALSLSDANLHVARHIMKSRLLAGLSFKELAEQANLDDELVSDYECGSVDIPVAHLFYIAAALNEPIDNFFPPSTHKH
jgi:ribosome-binding protein aMBF1 (putative translation factor)